MNLSRPFIHRPVATTLLTAGVALAGALCFNLLPVSPLPQVDFPVISVEASLPGASPETMASTVATPLERQLGRIAGVNEMTSSSTVANTRIILQFDLDRNIDGAARDVQAAINAARSTLPPLPVNPNYHKVNPADAPIMLLALTSETMTRGQMYDAASTVLAQKLSQVRGIGQVRVGGSSLPAVRVEMNPSALYKYGVGVDDVRAALASANANRPKGYVEDNERHWQIYASDQAKTANEYLPMIVTYRNGAPVRLANVADVADSVEDVRNEGLSNGKPAVLVILYRQPGANIIGTIDRVRSLLPWLRASIPNAINLDVVLDRSPTIRASLRDVERTLLISISLVIGVVFVFLRNPRTTIIPSVAVPVSLIGTFGVMYLFGFSLNNLSLMALTIATGFVVDDAIVVLENVTRHMENGMAPFQATLQGAREVAFTVLSMSLSLVAVFIPILLMGGIVGRLFREFSVTLSVAVLVSLLVSLTTTPMMCARLLKIDGNASHGRLYLASESAFEWIRERYRASLSWALRHSLITLLILLSTVALNIFLYINVHKGFFPQQDTGRLVGTIQADESISFQAMRKKLADFANIIHADPAVDSVVGFTGGGQRNSAIMFVSLKPIGERKLSADQVVARLRPKLNFEPGASLFLQSSQDIHMGGRPASAQYQFTLQGDDFKELNAWAPKIKDALALDPRLADVNSDQQDKGLQARLAIDRATAARLGITAKMIDQTLNDIYGQRQASTIYAQLNQYHVVMEAAPQFWQSPGTLDDVYILTHGGQQVPLSAISHFEPASATLAVNHQGPTVAATISFNLPAGSSLSDATKVVNDTMSRLGVPESIHGSFQGTARAFQASLANQPWLVLAALVTVYIVLGILYESYVHPITILSTLPSAGVGAILTLMLFHFDFDIMALIGVILLIGIVKKNAIMMIDFALDVERKQGLRPEEAIFQACLMRLRPILMTTMAALLGALPLALGFGEGAELRRPLGVAIVGGLVSSQLLTLYTTPVVYLYLDRFGSWVNKLRGKPLQPAAQG